MNKMEELAIEMFASVMGWVVAISGVIIGWAVRESIVKRLDMMEVRMQANSERLATMEKLITATVTHVELTRSVDELRKEISATRLEIKSDVQQIVALLKG